MRALVASACAIAALAATGVATASEPPATLRYNPFSRPPVVERAIESSRSASPVAERGALDLRGTLIGSRTRFANVGGRILAVGESVDGYVLVWVEENSATFEKNDTRITAYVKPVVTDTSNE